MIDIEPIVFNELTVKLREHYGEDYPELSIFNEYISFPEKFPCIYITETGNATVQKTLSCNENEERHAKVTFTVEVYTTGQEKKALGKDMADFCDSLMQGMKFTRTSFEQANNLQRGIYRATLRYSAVVEKARTITEDGEETIIYQIYRK